MFANYIPSGHIGSIVAETTNLVELHEVWNLSDFVCWTLFDSQLIDITNLYLPIKKSYDLYILLWQKILAHYPNPFQVFYVHTPVCPDIYMISD